MSNRVSVEKRARELLAAAYSDAACFSVADKLLRTSYVTDAREVVALRAIEAALRENMIYEHQELMPAKQRVDANRGSGEQP
jgi:hypothetical protein